MINYIKKQSYVEYLTGFSVLHFFNWHNERTGETLAGMHDLGKSKMNYIKGSVPEAVLIPSDEHMFTVIEEAEYSDALEIGIGNLKISNELIVYDTILSPNSKESEDTTPNLDDKEYIYLFISHDIK